MGKKAEQLRGCHHTNSKARKYQKRKLARLRRRAEKLDIENAPEKLRELIRGWVD